MRMRECLCNFPESSADLHEIDWNIYSLFQKMNTLMQSHEEKN